MKDVIGFKCNNLTVIKGQYHKKRGDGRNYLYVESKCKCGNKIEHGWDVIYRFKVTGCGKCKYSKSRKHGMRKHLLYSIYAEAKQRCNNKKHKKYKNYGGRGIKFLRDGFEEFYRDMGDKPSKEYSIGRINNDGNYCKENCRWELPIQQMNNITRNHIITYKGRTQTMKQRSRELGIPYDRIRHRINNYGYSIEDAFLNIKYKSGPKPVLSLLD